MKNILVHPSAKLKDDGLYEYDFALIQLSDQFQLSDSIMPICIAERSPESGQLCITAGWSDVDGEGVWSVIYVLRTLLLAI